MYSCSARILNSSASNLAKRSLRTYAAADDPAIGYGSVLSWSDFTTSEFAIPVLTGEHFYITERVGELVQGIEHRIAQWGTARRSPTGIASRDNVGVRCLRAWITAVAASGSGITLIPAGCNVELTIPVSMRPSGTSWRAAARSTESMACPMRGSPRLHIESVRGFWRQAVVTTLHPRATNHDQQIKRSTS